MSTRGKEETARLRQNVEQQLSRLLEQLQDLEDYREELDPEEWQEMREETLEALQEMKVNLSKMVSGNMTLVSELGAIQLAIQAAVSTAFQTPEVIRMFANKNSGQLRARLAGLERDSKLGKVPRDALIQQSVEILSALKKLGEQLSPEEESFLSKHMTASMAAFEGASSTIAAGAQQTLLNVAASSVKKAQQ